MAREFIQDSFFDHSRYANTYYAAQIPLEYFVSEVLLKGDLSRMIFTSDDMAFRRRFMANDSQNGGDIDAIQASDLNFPFANYWYSDGFWSPDDRPFSLQPMQMIRGTWHDGLPDYLRAAAVKATFSVTAFYNRDDDARLAYELMMWEQLPKGPVQFTVPVEWKNTRILIPSFFTVENLKFNPDFQESEWLKAQRIFPIKFDLVCRSYSIYMSAQERLDGTQRLQAPFATGLLNKDQGKLYISEEVILNFAAAKQWGALEVKTQCGGDGSDEEDPFTEEEIATKIADPREITTDLVRGHFQPSTDILVNVCAVDPASITTTSCILKWNIRPADLELFSHMKILIPGREPILIDDKRQKTQIIEGLYPSSDYRITVLFYSIAGGVTDFQLSVTTAEDPNNAVKRPLTRRMGKLQGMEW